MGFKAILAGTDVNQCEWATPVKLFEELDREFHFTLDPCATDENHKCERYFTKEQDGLAQDWSGETVFMNPPYGRDTAKWVSKAFNTHTHTRSLRCCPSGRTQDGFTIISMVRQRYDLLRAGLNTMTVSKLRPFRA